MDRPIRNDWVVPADAVGVDYYHYQYPPRPGHPEDWPRTRREFRRAQRINGRSVRQQLRVQGVKLSRRPKLLRFAALMGFVGFGLGYAVALAVR